MNAADMNFNSAMIFKPLISAQVGERSRAGPGAVGEKAESDQSRNPKVTAAPCSSAMMR